MAFYKIIYLNIQMSQLPPPPPVNAQQAQGEQQTMAILSYIKSSKDSVLKIREFDFKKLFTDIIVYISIVSAYFVISFTYKFNNQFQKLIKLNLTKLDSFALLIYIFSLYLILLHVLKRYLYNRALRKPVVADQYSQNVQEDDKYYKELPVLANQEKYAHDILAEICSKSVQFSFFLIAVLAYAFSNQLSIQKLHHLVDYQRINYILLWFLLASFFELSGRFLGKWTKVQEFCFFGKALFFIIGAMALGLANGLNTFVFI